MDTWDALRAEFAELKTDVCQARLAVTAAAKYRRFIVSNLRRHGADYADHQKQQVRLVRLKERLRHAEQDFQTALRLAQDCLAIVQLVDAVHIHASGPWVADRVFLVVPSQHLIPTIYDPTARDMWYAITKGHFVGVVSSYSLRYAAFVGISAPESPDTYSTQAAALGVFNDALVDGRFPPDHQLGLFDTMTSTPWPLYNLDEIIANLTLEEQEPKSDSLHPSPSTPRTTAPTIYRYSTPHTRTYTPDSSEAGHATQGTAGHVRVVQRAHRPRRVKAKAYVVFRGTKIGVFESWDSVCEGYPTRQDAERAFKLADDNGWTYCSGSARPPPPSIAHAPLPILPHAPLPPSALVARRHGDPWYVVYAGVNPGVFASYVECALNVLGIHNAVHESVLGGYKAAWAKFEEAQARGEVSTRRTPAAGAF
ncbi:hypothetical protein DFH09DRAFT_1342449 [Mycena vulgaris]|nr:hypothetical protein DFH09DRAFT_1342449 [Mycena vulgaris]